MSNNRQNHTSPKIGASRKSSLASRPSTGLTDTCNSRPPSRYTSSLTSSRVTNSRRTINRVNSRKNRLNNAEKSRDNTDENSNRRNDSDSDNEDARTRASIDDLTMDIDDKGWDTDLEIEEVKDTYDASGRSAYIATCKRQGVIPVSYFVRHMNEPKLVLRHHSLGPDSVKPMAVSLVTNTHVLKLDLSDNWLGHQGCLHICEMLKENCYITDLNLSDNKLGSNSAEPLSDIIQNNTTLTHLTLSGNEFDDTAAIFFAEAIMNGHKLEYLNLSNNSLGERAGIALGPAISENSTLKNLDLSWNCIRRKGAIAIAAGIKQNIYMKSINLSWNGFGNEGALAIGNALKENAVLETLDLANNRIATEGAVLFGKGLMLNESLRTLKMGKNPMQSAGCWAICASIVKNPNCILEELDFTDILVNEDFLEMFKQCQEVFPELKVKHGSDNVPLKPKARVHPMVKLQNYITKNNLRLIDFFQKFDKDKSMSVTRAQFAQGIEEIGISLTQEEVGLLVAELDRDGDGEINYSEMVIGHQDFKDKEKKATTVITAFQSSLANSCKS